MKTAVSIPDPLFESADRVAKHLRISRSELYARALGEFLQEHDPDRITQALDVLYAEEPDELDDALLEMQHHALGNERW